MSTLTITGAQIANNEDFYRVVVSDDLYQCGLIAPTNSAVLTVVPNITINNDAEEEGTDLIFTVTLSHAISTDITIPFTTNDGTATIADSDYTDNDSNLVITAGDTNGIITVLTTTDTTPEPNETITVNLGTPSLGTITDGIGLGTINNDDLFRDYK